MRKKIKSGVYFLIIPCLTYFLHEVFHWLAYLFYGIDAFLTLNGIQLPEAQLILTKEQQLIIYGSGVLFTFSQGILAYYLLLKRANKIAYISLLSVFILRFAAELLNFAHPSDEGKISLALGLPQHFISFFVVGLLAILVYRTVRHQNYSFLKVLGEMILVLLTIYLYSLLP